MDELREQIRDLMGYSVYGKSSKYDELWDKARAIVRERDKPEYTETLNELAEEEFQVLIVNQMLDLINRQIAEAEINVIDMAMRHYHEHFDLSGLIQMLQDRRMRIATLQSTNQIEEDAE